ncbi:hypothetical protein E4U43_004797 [Claviceps pusilla]|uniref:Uncharacterized protein n=1 Tax=Claviceps pusilla TaxID=123648 RepID=A0A9P7T2V1_9HYPO|nr:hypothetical protein E4U43_004797 [Claviceps pusilla]
MEAAAKTVEVLSKRILPEKPHHLSFSSTWRHRPDPEDDETAESRVAKRRFEEWHNPRLQYLTLLSEADRGTLLTRSYYDMREEPLKPVPREVTALSKGSSGEKKKLSLSDYKNKKTGLVASASPPEPAIAKRKESERTLLPPSGSATSTPATSHADGGKPYQEPRRLDGPSRTRDSDAFSASAKPKLNREGVASESRLPPKPASLPPRPPSPAGKRRIPDVDDERPLKRSRPDERRPWDDRLQRDRDDVSRRRDKVPPPPSRDRDHRDVAGNASSKDDRGNPPPSVSSSSVSNGRALLKAPTNPGRNTSPAARPRGDSVNGVRPSVAGNNSSRGTPTKADTTGSKSLLPPLLSPLHLSFESQEKEKRSRAEEDDANAKKDKEKKRRDDTNDGSVSAKPKKLESTSSTAAKKPRSTVSIPPLLSPTLPPTVEAELKRRKKAISADSSEERSVKKRSATDEDVDDDVKLDSAPVNKLGHRRRLVVSLNVPKSLQSSFAKIIGHAPEHKKESCRQSSDAELDRKPRAGGDDGTHQPPARKRPVHSVDGPSAAEATATKRPRSSDLSANPKLGTPLTPSRKTTAMSRVSSTNSVAQTPTGLANSTPVVPLSMSAAGSADKRPNGHEKVAGKGERLDGRILREKETTFMAVGKKLKHEADPILKQYHSDSLLNMTDRSSEYKIKLAYVLGLESIIAFMLAFHAQNVHRAMYNKIGDPQCWNTMFPLMDCLVGEMRRNDISNQQPLYAMLLLFYGITIDEIIKCYVQCDDSALSVTLETLAQHERRKYKTWLQLHQANAAVQNPKARVDVHPWSTLDDIADASLRVLRSWCAEENIDWAPDQIIMDNWPVKPNPGYSRR